VQEGRGQFNKEHCHVKWYQHYEGKEVNEKVYAGNVPDLI